MVLVEFPSQDMRAVGLVAQVVSEAETGRKLAIVYVPTTPIPTSGFTQIVPLDRLAATDWMLDEAMNFIISAGTASSRNMYFSNPRDHEYGEPGTEAAPDSAK